MKTPLELKEYYSEDYSLIEEKNIDIIKEHLSSMTSAHWGQTRIGDTEYFQLAQLSPAHQGDNPTIIYCELQKVNQIINQ